MFNRDMAWIKNTFPFTLTMLLITTCQLIFVSLLGEYAPISKGYAYALAFWALITGLCVDGGAAVRRRWRRR